MQILRTTSENNDFQNLVKKLDAYLTEIDGEDHAFYDQYNKIDLLKNCIVIFDDDKKDIGYFRLGNGNHW